MYLGSSPSGPAHLGNETIMTESKLRESIHSDSHNLLTYLLHLFFYPISNKFGAWRSALNFVDR